MRSPDSTQIPAANPAVEQPQSTLPSQLRIAKQLWQSTYKALAEARDARAKAEARIAHLEIHLEGVANLMKQLQDQMVNGAREDEDDARADEDEESSSSSELGEQQRGTKRPRSPIAGAAGSGSSQDVTSSRRSRKPRVESPEPSRVSFSITTRGNSLCCYVFDGYGGRLPVGFKDELIAARAIIVPPNPTERQYMILFDNCTEEIAKLMAGYNWKQLRSKQGLKDFVLDGEFTFSLYQACKAQFPPYYNAGMLQPKEASDEDVIRRVRSMFQAVGVIVGSIIVRRGVSSSSQSSASSAAGQQFGSAAVSSSAGYSFPPIPESERPNFAPGVAAAAGPSAVLPFSNSAPATLASPSRVGINPSGLGADSSSAAEDVQPAVSTPSLGLLSGPNLWGSGGLPGGDGGWPGQEGTASSSSQSSAVGAGVPALVSDTNPAAFGTESSSLSAVGAQPVTLTSPQGQLGGNSNNLWEMAASLAAGDYSAEPHPELPPSPNLWRSPRGNFG